jgi:hypothetical protein
VPQHNWYWLYPPLDLKAQPLGGNTVRLSWSAAACADCYRIYRSRFADMADMRLVGETEDLLLELCGEPGGDNYYSVRAVERRAGQEFRVSEPGPPAQFTAPVVQMQPDTLYAVPESSTVRRGESVRVTVFAHQTASPLRNMNIVRVSFETGNSYTKGSFNIGAPGGAADAPDGVWAADIGENGFLLAPDSFMTVLDLGTGRSCLDFNVTPLLGEREIHSATGALFNFELTVNTDVHLGFIRFDTVGRTFYSGMDREPRFWANDFNDGQQWIRVTDH